MVFGVAWSALTGAAFYATLVIAQALAAPEIAQPTLRRHHDRAGAHRNGAHRVIAVRQRVSGSRRRPCGGRRRWGLRGSPARHPAPVWTCYGREAARTALAGTTCWKQAFSAAWISPASRADRRRAIRPVCCAARSGPCRLQSPAIHCRHGCGRPGSRRAQPGASARRCGTGTWRSHSC